jgi:uncharacterized protein YihD (DUF1040 family)
MMKQLRKVVVSMSVSKKAKNKTVKAAGAKKPVKAAVKPAKVVARPVKAAPKAAKPAKPVAKVAKPVKPTKPVKQAKPVKAEPKQGHKPEHKPAEHKVAKPVEVKTAPPVVSGPPQKVATKASAKAAAKAAASLASFGARGTQLAEGGDAVCREVACENLATSGGYCRMHYIKNWKKIKRKEIILREKKLNQYIEELVAKYPDKYIEAIRQDLANDKDFAKVIRDLDLDESIDDYDVEGESVDALVDGIRRDFEDDSDF